MFISQHFAELLSGDPRLCVSGFYHVDCKIPEPGSQDFLNGRHDGVFVVNCCQKLYRFGSGADCSRERLGNSKKNKKITSVPMQNL